MHFRRANTDSGGPLQIHEGQYGFRRANTEPSMHFRKANTEPSMHFRRANMEPSMHFRKANTELSMHFRRANTESYYNPSFPPLLLRFTQYFPPKN